MKTFRTLCMTDSAKKSDTFELSEEVDLDFSVGFSFSGRIRIDDSGNFHSGRFIIAVAASSTDCRSAPDTEWPFLPFSISSNATHHLLRI